MADVGLVPVVEPTVAAGYQQHPQLPVLDREQVVS